MISVLKNYLYEPKSKIGWVHGSITVLGSIILGYLTMMIFSKFIPLDLGVKIVPSMILTPVLIACYSIWLLLSKTIAKSLIKLFSLALVFITILEVF